MLENVNLKPQDSLENSIAERLPRESECLGRVDWDAFPLSNERVTVRVNEEQQERLVRNLLVHIREAGKIIREYIGRVVSGPFFFPDLPQPEMNGADAGTRGPASALGRRIVSEVEIVGELANDQVRAAQRRPAPGATVVALDNQVTERLLGCGGDMRLGCLSGRDSVLFHLRSQSKGVLPRNVGIFGTVGSGKSNAAQVLVEEATAQGWAAVVVDVEGEYVAMDAPSDVPEIADVLKPFDRQAAGLPDFTVYHPAGCPGQQTGAEFFCLRLADFETAIIAEILETSLAERNALYEGIEYLQNQFRARTNQQETWFDMLDPSPQAKLPFTLSKLRDRAAERGSRSTDQIDFVGLASRLQRLQHTGTFDQFRLPSIDAKRLIQPGRVSVFDVSAATDAVQNLVTADLLRKLFAAKIAYADLAPTLLVIEEAHTFLSRDRVNTSRATLQMLRNVARRGRKRWLSLVFVSQQPGHLPPELFELCNTRIVHNLRSLQNLEALMTTAGDIDQSLWERCPLLGVGEAIISSPQLTRPVVVHIRPASSRRMYTHAK